MRADQIAFFANGDFQSTGQYNNGGGEKTVAGNVAIIFYGLENGGANNPREKVLVRRQTILTSDADLTQDLDFDGQTEYYKKSMSELIAESFDVNDMMKMWILNPSEPNDLVTYLAEGVDDFTIQFAEWNSLNKKFEWPPRDESEFDKYKMISSNAFKFTFTLYDSKGVLKDGKTFTHIVYLGD
jgi:hypothetical protein